MCTWFAGNAVAPQLAEAWGLDAAQAGWLTSAVQLGFVFGTAASAALNLPDVVSGRTLVAVSALGAALSNAALTAVPGFGSALASRFACGVFLAGVYPPAMKMAATWFRSGRGLAIGMLIGALTVGKALPYLVGSLADVPWRTVVWTVSAGSVAASLLIALAYRDGPFPFPRMSSCRPAQMKWSSPSATAPATRLRRSCRTRNRRWLT
jgi:MFS family permease